VAGGGAALLHAVSALNGDDNALLAGGTTPQDPPANGGPAQPPIPPADVTGDYAIRIGIVRRALSEPATLIALNAGYPAAEVVAQSASLGPDDGFDALSGRHGNMIEMGIIDPLRVVRSALQNGASVAGLLLTTNTLVAEEQTPWGGSPALMTEYGSLDEGLHQPSPDPSTPQSLGLGPSVG